MTDELPRYVRRHNGKFQARPIRAGRRYNLGYFPSIREASKALALFAELADPLDHPRIAVRHLCRELDYAGQFYARAPGTEPVAFGSIRAAAEHLALLAGVTLEGLVSRPAKSRKPRELRPA